MTIERDFAVLSLNLVPKVIHYSFPSVFLVIVVGCLRISFWQGERGGWVFFMVCLDKHKRNKPGNFSECQSEGQGQGQTYHELHLSELR